LADMAERDGEFTAEDRGYLATIAERDNPFALIDYRDFAARQGQPAVTPPVVEQS
jgi:hypothetical protein